MHEIKNIIEKMKFFNIPNSTRKQNLNQLHCMAELGRISPGILHDVLNPITGLILYLDLIKDSVHKNSDSGAVNQMQTYITPVIESSHKIRDIIKIIQRDLSEEALIKNLSRENENVDINEVIENVIKLFSYKSVRNNVSIVFLRKPVSPVFARKMQIYQIFINLISNAIDAFDGSVDTNGDCGVRAERKKKNKIGITVTENDGFIFVKISDNGCGIAEKDLGKIFDRNYTNKKNGLGIGLYSTKQIVEQNLRGKIKFESTLSKGTVCNVKIKAGAARH